VLHQQVVGRIEHGLTGPLAAPVPVAVMPARLFVRHRDLSHAAEVYRVLDKTQRCV
jgi:hypothetical protein